MDKGENPVNSVNHHNDRCIHKKKKRRISESVSDLGLPLSADGGNASADEVEILEVRDKNNEVILVNCDTDSSEELSRDKKKKKKRRSKFEMEEDLTSKIGNDAKINEEPEDALSQKKKKKKSAKHSSVEEDPEGFVRVKEVAVAETLLQKKQKKKSEKNFSIEEGPEEFVKVMGEPVDDTLPQKKKKKKSEKNFSIEGGPEEFVKVMGEPVDDTLPQKKKKKKSEKNFSIEEGPEEFVKVEEIPVDDTLPQKKKKRKSEKYFSIEEGPGKFVKVEEDTVDDTLPKKKKKRKSEKKFCVEEGPEKDDTLTKVKKERKLVCDSSIKSVDCSVKVKEEPSDDTMSQIKKKKKQECKEVNITSVHQENHFNRTSKNENKMSFNKNDRVKHDITKIAVQQKERIQPKCRLILPQNTEDWQPMIFKFDNHPNVRHYVPRKLMAMNGIKQQLGEVDEVDLKIPIIIFEGSSLDDIPGYGYCQAM